MGESDQSQILQFHAFLLGETGERLTRFERALTQRISRGDVVLDLGSGTGVLAFLALRVGASKVYAIEDTDAVELARALSAANGIEDRIVLQQRWSSLAELPEQADVLVADIFDIFGLLPRGLGFVADARRRLLTPSAALIPSALEFHLAPVEAPQLYEQRITFWTREISGFDLSSIHRCAMNNRYPNRFERSALLSEPAMLARIELKDFETPLIAGDVKVAVARAGVLHGLCGWFVADLAKGITLSNTPGDTTTRYSQAFFPIERAIAVKEGDTVSMGIHSYDNLGCKWQVEVSAGSQVLAKSRHSTSFGFPLSDERLRALLPSYRPQLTRRGEAQRLLLTLCDGQQSLETLTAIFLERYAVLFRSPDDTVGFIRSTLAPAT